MRVSDLKGKERIPYVHKSCTGEVRTDLVTGYTIYSLINLDNGKRYIGRTTNPRSRILCHMNGIKSGKHPNKMICDDRKCQFGFEILEDHIIYSESGKKEREYMVKYRTYLKEFGYNCNDNLVKDLVEKTTW